MFEGYRLLPTNHREFFKQCEAIAQTGDYQLVSCMTNRSGLVDQVYTGVDFEDFDMRNHVQAGIDLFEKYGNHVQPTYKSVAGIMLMFPKSIWTKVGGFEEGGIVDKNFHFHDYNFSMEVKKAGGKIGIARGFTSFICIDMVFLIQLDIYINSYERRMETNPRL